MFLEFGINEHGEAVHISAVKRGKTPLACPYCEGLLTAKRGRKVSAHFAHTGATCRQITKRKNNHLAIPSYEDFYLSLNSSTYKALRDYHEDGLGNPRSLEPAGLVAYNAWARGGKGDWELTNVGKIPFGLLTLKAFAEWQVGQIADRRAYLASLDDPDAGTDLKLFEAQVKRISSLSLYLLEIIHDAGTLYKIGVTGRDIQARIAEIKRDLHPHFGAVKIEALRVLVGRGLVERYAHHRYRDRHLTVGTMTGYYQFEPRRAVLSDFTRLGNVGETKTFTRTSRPKKRRAKFFAPDDAVVDVDGETVSAKDLSLRIQDVREKLGLSGLRETADAIGAEMSPSQLSRLIGGRVRKLESSTYRMLEEWLENAGTVEEKIDDTLTIPARADYYKTKTGKMFVMRLGYYLIWSSTETKDALSKLSDSVFDSLVSEFEAAWKKGPAPKNFDQFIIKIRDVFERDFFEK